MAFLAPKKNKNKEEEEEEEAHIPQKLLIVLSA